MEEYSGFWDSHEFYEDETEQPASVFQIYKLCLEPTLHEILPYICKLIIINFVFRLSTQTGQVSKHYCHVLSAVCGVIAFYSTLRFSIFHISFFIICCYIVFHITYYLSNRDAPYFLSIVCGFYLIISEFFFPIPDAWNECRGMHMIAAMKVISISFDMTRKTIKSFPTAVEYFGYMFCPSNCLLGPWVSFNTYKSVLTYQPATFNFSWLRQVMNTTLISVVFLTISNCWAYYLIPQYWRWLGAYQEAFSFRSSHYFISFLSEASMIAGGFGYVNVKRKRELSWAFEVTRPFKIEFPRSLVQVVVFWNIPMHMWLKTYVFEVCKPMGSFCAVIMTYVISSLLHGLNLKLAAVLLSLGFYTYIEYRFRCKISVIFDACIGANPCKKCEHVYTNNHTSVRLTNLVFSVVSVFHLAYLGCLLESISEDTYLDNNESEVFLKWKQLDYASHCFTVFQFIIYNLI